MGAPNQPFLCTMQASSCAKLLVKYSGPPSLTHSKCRRQIGAFLASRTQACRFVILQRPLVWFRPVVKASAERAAPANLPDAARRVPVPAHGRRLRSHHGVIKVTQSATVSHANSAPTAPVAKASSAQLSCRRSKFAVFVSGGGSNFRALHQAASDGRVNGTIAVLVSDRPGCGGWQYAQSVGIPVMQFPSKKFAPGEHAVSAEDLPGALHQLGVQFICLAGFLKLIPVGLVRAFPRSILNIHPALLPAFGGAGYYGARVHRAVVASGVKFTGATIHFIDEEYDTGPILAQKVVPVFPTDSPDDVAARVLKQEHELYPQAVAALCDNRVIWRADGVPSIAESTRSNVAAYQQDAAVSNVAQVRS